MIALGPGRHRWRTPDPTRPVSAFFVLTSPVDVSFDMITGFVIPQNGQPVRIRATGSLQVRCADPGLLIAQFVGLPFDMVNDGVLRSVRRSVERMLARLLTRRVVMAGTAASVTDSATLQQIVEELVAYNPTAGAVFGVELIRMGYVAIGADDGTGGPLEIPAAPTNGSNGRASQSHIQKPTDRAPAQEPVAAVTVPEPAPPGSPNKFKRPPTPRLDQQPGLSPSQMASQSAQASSAGKEFTSTVNDGLANKRPDFSLKDGATVRGVSPFAAKTVDGEETTTPAPTKRPPTAPPVEVRSSSQGAQASGEIGMKARPSEGDVTSGEIRSGEIRSGEIRSGEINKPKLPRPTLDGIAPPASSPPPRRAAPMIVPSTDDEITEPAPPSPTPPAGAADKVDIVPQRPSAPTIRGAAPLASAAAAALAASAAKAGSGNTAGPTKAPEPPRSVLGIGMGAIGIEPPKEAATSKVPVGGRVLVPGPNGLMQSATVRQLLQGYYEIEIGSTGQTVWVPIAGVVPD